MACKMIWPVKRADNKENKGACACIFVMTEHQLYNFI